MQDTHPANILESSCALNSLTYFVRNFTIGWTAQLLMSTVLRPKHFLRSPIDVFMKRLFDKNNLYFGLFLGSFSAVYKSTNCALRWYTNKSEVWHSLVAAICAGMSSAKTFIHSFSIQNTYIFIKQTVNKLHYRIFIYSFGQLRDEQGDL